MPWQIGMLSIWNFGYEEKRKCDFMTDKRIKMDCPFCGHDKSDIQITELVKCKNGNYCEIYCPECGAKFSGYGKQNVIDKWNRRV